MSYVIADRVQQTTTTAGVGTLTLSATVPQYQSFSSGIGTGNTCDYALLSGNGVDWETGNGTVIVSGGVTTLSRDLIYASTASGVAISLRGTSFVFVTVTATKITAADFDGIATGISAGGTNQSGATALTARQNYVSTAVDGTNGVRIAASLMIPGNHIYITNEHATNKLVCYPDTGNTINAEAPNAALSGGILANSTAHFIVKSTSALRTVP